MCQLLGLSSASPVRLSFSWQHFALRGSEAGGNPDGWGVAYADARDARVLREPVPAVDSPLVTFLGQHGPASTTVVSHVRRATDGGTVLANTQPFVRVLGGRAHVFAHNGHIPGLRVQRDVWLQPVGSTDSEKMFCALLGRLAPLWANSDAPDLARRTDVIATFAAEMRTRGAANFLYFDGLTLFAHGHRRTIRGRGISPDPGLYVIMCDDQPDADADADAAGVGVVSAGPWGKRAMVATTPLDQQPWRPLSSGELVRLEWGQQV